MKQFEEEDLCTVTELAELLHFSGRTIRDRLKRKEIKGIQVGGKGPWRIPRSEVVRLLGGQKATEDLLGQEEISLQKPLGFPYKGEFEASKTKETKMEHLPPWVNQAQQDHLDGIRQLLERFRDCFLGIYPSSRRFWAPLSDHESVQLHGHLREVFWSQVKDFTDKAGECEGLLDAAHKRFTSAGEKLALLPPLAGPTPGAYITLDWGRRGVSRALGPPLGFEHLASYHVEALAGDNCRLICDGLIYRGSDAAKARKKHQRLVKRFQARDDFNQIVNLMKDLRNLRQQIIVRINQCLQDKEYIHYYCPSCPVYPFIRDFLPEEGREPSLPISPGSSERCLCSQSQVHSHK